MTAINNPFRVGQEAIAPAGAVVHSTHPSRAQRILKRRQAVTITGSYSGWVDTTNHAGMGLGYVHLPVIEWVGSGGYWQRIQLTDEVLGANDLPPLIIPGATDGIVDGHQMDVIPSVAPGYCNRWERPHIATAP